MIKEIASLSNTLRFSGFKREADDIESLIKSSSKSFQDILDESLKKIDEEDSRGEEEVYFHEYSVEGLMMKLNATGEPHRAEVSVESYISFLHEICHNRSFPVEMEDVSGTVKVNIVLLAEILNGPNLPNFMIG
mgnify:CR=1 FL=1